MYCMDVDRCSGLRRAKEELCVIMREKEDSLGSKKPKQRLLVDMFSPGRIASDSFSATKVDTQQLYAKIASFFYENALPFNIASSPSFAAIIESSFNFR